MRSFGGLILAVVLAFPGMALADTLETPSHVTAATIFNDRAIVTREAKLHVPAGTHMVSVIDIPAGLNEATLRVQGKAGAAVKIGAVEVKHVFLTDQANALEHEKTTALQAKTDEKSFLEAEVKALQARETFINNLAAAGTNKPDAPTTAAKPDSPAQWAQAWGLIQSGMAETQKDLVTKQIAIRKTDNDIAQLQQDLQQIKSPQGKERREAHIAVESAADTELDLNLTYQTGGATWRSVYDARLDTNNSSVDMEQYGQVAQNTGEDWTDVALTFSTAQPALGADMPKLGEWLVNLFDPNQLARFSMAKAQSLAASVATANGAVMQEESASMDAVPAAAPRPMQEAEAVTAEVQTTDYAAEFHVPGHVSLKSTRDMSKFPIGSVHMKADLKAETTPRLAPQAFLTAKVTNGESYPLIPGTIAKYRDGDFIGNGSLDLLRPGETADLGFGVDDRIKVSYQRTKDQHDNPTLVVMGDAKVEREYQTKVQNLHKNPIAVVVYEQYPAANNADVKSELLTDSTTPNYAKDPDNRPNIILWSETLKSQEEKTYTLGFRVNYPKGKQLIGL